MDVESPDERDVDLVEQSLPIPYGKTYANGATQNRKQAIRNKPKDGELLPFPLA